MHALENLGRYSDKTLLDVSPVIGNAQTSLPLITLAYALKKSLFGKSNDKKYILSVFSSQVGFNSAVILKKE